MLFTPLLGVTMLPATMKTHRATGRAACTACFDACCSSAMRWRWLTIGAHRRAVRRLALRHAASSQQQFFPASDRPELIVDLTLPQNASIAETQDADGPVRGRRWPAIPTSTIGRPMSARARCGSCSPSTCSSANPYFGQIVIVTKGLEARDRVQARARAIWRAQQFVGTDVYVKPLELGPPVGRPVQYRVSGPDIQTVRDAGAAIRRPSIGDQPASRRHHFDWNEPARVVKVDVLQDKARQLGVTSQDIAAALNSVVGGTTITQVRDGIYLVDVVGARARRRARLDRDAAEPAAAGPATARRCRSRRSRTSATSSSSRWCGGATACRPSRSRPASSTTTQPATVVARARADGRGLHRARCRPAIRSQSAARSRKAARRRGRSPPWCR